MKRMVNVLGMLLVGGTFLMAQTFSATGYVKWNWGYDVDHRTSGFEVTFKDMRFDVSLADKTTVEKTGDTAPYGEIRITGLRVGTNADNSSTSDYITPVSTIGDSWKSDWQKRPIYLLWDQLSSKLVFTDNFNIVLWYNETNKYQHSMAFTLYNGDSYGISNAYAYSLYSGQYGSTDVAGSLYNSWEVTGDEGTPTNKVFFKASNYDWKEPTNNAYVQVNYSLPFADLSALVGSYKSYKDTSRFVYDANGNIVDNGNNGYTGIFSVSLTAIPNLTAVVAGTADLGIPDTVYSPPAFGGKVQYKFALNDDIAIKPGVYFDGQLPDIDSYAGAVPSTDGFDWAVAGGLQVDFLKSVFTTNVGYGNDASKTSTVNSLRATGALDFKTVPNLIARAAVEYIKDDLKAEGDGSYSLGFHGYVSYDLPVGKGTVAPYVEGSSSNKSNGKDFDLYMKAGVSLSGFMANTIFTVFWDSNDLTNKFNTYKDAMFGRIVFRTAVKF
ncbi:MAG: hypothetical protein WHT84_06130 [Breznakiellaceae bacterium]